VSGSARGAPRGAAAARRALVLLLSLALASSGCRRAPVPSEQGRPDGAVAAGSPRATPDRVGELDLDAVRESGRLPGAEPHPPVLRARLARALAERPAGVPPRTRHVDAAGRPRWSNRLLLESSPYLRQHAHNPVDWYPWGDEAFEAARRLGRPVLLSVGYSTCHWCHVMEEESFEDEAIAAFINAHYVAIKVDREQRPDVDASYMAAVQLLTGHGGWPMTVWLTPDRAPFYGGTYFPARDGDRGRRVGFLTLLERLSTMFRTEPAEVAAGAQRVAAAIRARLEPEGPAGLAAGSIEAVYTQALDRVLDALEARYDPQHGGVRGAPKFPSSLPVRLLLRLHRRTGLAGPRDMALATLDHMAAGGLRDQLGGGYHRYATDAAWTVPYDNALLALAGLEAFQLTGDPARARGVLELLADLRRTLGAPEGGFYSATDADSPGPDGRREEGLYFTWTPAELVAVLGSEDGRLAAEHFGVVPDGPLEGRSVLTRRRSPAAVAAALGRPPAEVVARLPILEARLLAARARRPPPLRDEKVLTAWNGLAISAFARAGLVLGRAELVATATRAADFALERLRVDGRLHRSFAAGRAEGAAFLDDYAALIGGLLDAFEAAGAPHHLRAAIELEARLVADFEDPSGGFYLSSAAHDAPLARERPIHDGAEPPGNAWLAEQLLRLSDLTGQDAYRARADRLLAAFGPLAAQRPESVSELLIAADHRLGRPKEIVLVADGPASALEPFRRVLARVGPPHRALVPISAATPRAELEALLPGVIGKRARGGRPTAWVCERFVCDRPTTDPAAFERSLRRAPHPVR
jgi:uncharacterized protein YyaL (SSP411 family)